MAWLGYAWSTMNKIAVPFFLVLSGLLAALVAACGGGDSDTNTDALATRAAGIEPQAEVTVTAEGLEYDTDLIVVPAAREVTITLVNNDGGALHNISVYWSSDATADLYNGELFTGVETREYTFTSPEPGTYYFKCDAHPDMNGAFITK